MEPANTLVSCACDRPRVRTGAWTGPPRGKRAPRDQVRFPISADGFELESKVYFVPWSRLAARGIIEREGERERERVAAERRCHAFTTILDVGF